MVVGGEFGVVFDVGDVVLVVVVVCDELDSMAEGRRIFMWFLRVVELLNCLNKDQYPSVYLEPRWDTRPRDRGASSRATSGEVVRTAP